MFNEYNILLPLLTGWHRQYLRSRNFDDEDEVGWGGGVGVGVPNFWQVDVFVDLELRKDINFYCEWNSEWH